MPVSTECAAVLLSFRYPIASPYTYFTCQMFLIESYRRSFKCTWKTYLGIKVIHDHWGYVHTIVDIFAPPWKSERIRLLFTHKNGCGGGFLWWNKLHCTNLESSIFRSRSLFPRENGGVADLSQTWSLTYRIAFVPYFGAVWTPDLPTSRAQILFTNAKPER